MKKIIFFPIWNVDELEKRLTEYAESGYIVSKIKYSYFFYFKKVSPKEIDYYLSYFFARDESMMACGRYIKGNKISGNRCFYSLYRTGIAKEDLNFFRGARADYIKSVLRIKTVIFLAFFLFSLLCLFLDFNKMTELRLGFYCSILSVFFLLTCYYSFGQVKQIKNAKNLNESNTRIPWVIP